MDMNITAQYYIEEKFDKTKVRKKLITEIVESFYFQIEDTYKALCKYKEQDNPKWLQERLDKAFTIDLRDCIAEVFFNVIKLQRTSIQSVIGSIVNRMPYDLMYHKLYMASDIVVMACYSGVFDIVLPADSETGSALVQAKFKFDEETEKYIAETMYLPPMLCKPRTVSCNDHCGYLTRKESLILKSHENHHDLPLAYDAINILNSFELSLDMDILEYEEKPNKVLDTLEKKKAFNLLKFSSREVYQMIVEEGNKYYFTWKPDKRGRMYSQGYHVNLQSSDYKKALTSLSKKRLIPKD